MDFSDLEKNVRERIKIGKTGEALELLNAFFKEDADSNEIALLSATYFSIVEKSRLGTTSDEATTLAINRLGSHIFDFLTAKKAYLKYKELTFGASASPTIAGNEHDAITVFFSVGSPHNDAQHAYIKHLTEYFSAHGIKLETLKGWDDNDPLIPIIQELKKSSGCLVLALERYYVNQGVAKRGSEQANEIKDRAFTSPWLHIETALARSFDLPLIILKEESLENEGLIHNDKQEWGIVRINQANCKEIEEYPIKNFILSWINQVKKYARQNK